jgi:hypothetical protein
MILRHEITIGTTPGQISSFFEAMDVNYRRWHPDHLLYRWEEGRGLREGVVVYFEEVIGGKMMRKRVVFTRIVPDRHVEFAFTNRFFRLIMPRMVFRYEPTDGGVVFTTENHIRTGPIGAWLNRREFDAVREHMREEGENLKRILEGEESGGEQRGAG